MPSSNHKSPPESFDAHLVAPIQCGLASAFLLALTTALGSRLSFPRMARLGPVLYPTFSVLLDAAVNWRHSSLSLPTESRVDPRWAVALPALSSEPSPWVQIEVDGEPHLNDSTATELFHSAAEGIGHIRPDTQAPTVPLS
jgi:hypothetical protein